jgi:single-strand DNA-binding protein
MKGQGVAISGELSLRKYKSKDGSEGASMEVRVQDVTLIGKKEDNAPMTPQMASKSMSKADGGFDNFEDVPF